MDGEFGMLFMASSLGAPIANKVSIVKTSSGCSLLFLLVFLCSLGCLYILDALRPERFTTDPHVASLPPKPAPSSTSPPSPEPQPAPALEPPAPPTDHYVDVNSLNEYRKSESAQNYNLTYGFIDYQGESHKISCRIPKEVYEKEIRSFGCNEKEIEGAVDQDMRERIDQAIQERGLDGYAHVDHYGSYTVMSDLEHYRLTDAERERLQGEIQELEKEMGEFTRIREQTKARLYRERGFLVRNKELLIDYEEVTSRSKGPLRSCFEAIRESAKGYNERQYIGLYLAFFQEIRYVLPPDKVGNQWTGGLWVPTEVVVNNHGDCDSKSLGFAAMCSNLGLQVAVIRVPGHVLTGVESRPWPDEKFVRIGNRYFVLCEPAGPGKLKPGDQEVTRLKGNFEYKLIE